MQDPEHARDLPTPRANTLAGRLRDIADQVAVALPDVAAQQTFTLNGAGSSATLGLHSLDRDALAAFARAFPKVTKHGTGDTFWLAADLGDGLTIAAFAADRDQVCRKVVTGTRTVPEQVIPAHEQDVIEWVCDEPLLAPEQVAS